MRGAPTRRGRLLVVATPLGNLGDLSRNAHEALQAADLVCAEDTRRTGGLLSHLGLKKPQLALHKFSEAERLNQVLAVLAEGQTVALVSDGGTPCLSDPGHLLVAAAHAAGHQVSPIAGPSALAAALSAAGFPADRVLFAGFLPARSGPRRRELERLAAYPETLAFYEAPHRLLEFLDDALALLGDREVFLGRELTKLHEETRRTTLSALIEEFKQRGEILGEITLVIAGNPDPEAPLPAHSPRDEALAHAWQEALEAENRDPRRAIKRLARDLGLARDELRRRLQRERLIP